MSGIKIALAGVGKIARDQHMPALARVGTFDLAALVTLDASAGTLPTFATLTEMKGALPDVAAVAICTPPRARLTLVPEAFHLGLDVMVEKPPAATPGEARHFIDLAARARRVLHVSWHTRFAPGVAPARSWLAGKTIQWVNVWWKEDVRIWHPGQAWIWEPGIGVFDPGINALSVLTDILPGPLVVEDASLVFPANKAAPIAASIRMRIPGGAPVTVELDFNHRGTPRRDIEVATDQGLLALSASASRLCIDEVPLEVGAVPEYHRLYRRFAELIATRRSDTDLAPFDLVADSFMLARREVAPAFEDF